MVPRARVELATSSSSGKRYYQLSYLGINAILAHKSIKEN